MKKKLKKKSKKVKAEETTGADDVSDTESSDDVESDSQRSKVDYDEFVRTWRDSNSVSEVASALNIKRNSASAIAARLRKAKVDLKRFPRRGSQPIDVKHLNRIASGKAT